MSITYTNRKGRTYYLCQGVTKTGKPRYYFAREPKGTPVEEIPEGWEIRESVNGVVSLAKIRPVKILPREEEAVQAEIERHPRAHNYRIDVKDDRITVYERAGTDPDDLILRMRRSGLSLPGLADQLWESLDSHARFTPVLRFILVNEETRTFCVERWCYLGSIDDWISVGPMGPVSQVARQWVPKLGTDALFEVY
jgi:hypothetical protein